MAEDGYGTICKADVNFSTENSFPEVFCKQEQKMNCDADLSNFLDMDTGSTLTELASGVCGDWGTGLFADLDMLDPTTGLHETVPTSIGGGGCGNLGGQPPVSVGGGHQSPLASSLGLPPGMEPSSSLWLLEETQKLERQQKLQQQKLFELQQTLLKTEILKNQLQIANISQSQQQHTATKSLSPSPPLGGGGGTTGSRGGGGGGDPSQYGKSVAPQFTIGGGGGGGGGGNGSASSLVVGGPGSNMSLGSGGPTMVVPKGVQQVPSSPSSRVNSPPQQLVKQQQHQLLPASSSSPPPPHHQNHHHHHHPPALLNNDVGGGDPRGLKSQTQQTRVGHQQQDQLGEQVIEPDKRKVHNQIEKKYRTSINDRICTLREIVYKHSKDSKRLQKSAVLQKTLDYIYYLEGQSKRLRQENAQLRNAITKLTGGTVRLASPVPDSHTSPLSSESGDDSGHPSSPEECLDDFPPANLCSNEHHSQQQKLQQQQHQQKDIKSNAGAGAGGRQGFLSGISLGGTSSDNGRPSATSQLFLCTMLVAVLFVSPLSLLPSSSLHSRGGGIDVVHGGGRALSSFGAASGEEEAGLLGVLAVYLLWCVRLLVAGACFGLVMLRSLPKVSANSKKAVDFRRHKNQAFNELKKGDLMRASDNLILSLSDIGRPIPTSYYGLVTGALWSYLTHLLFQLYVGRCAVALVGLCVKRPSFHIRLDGGKKYHYGVTAADVADTYHLLLQINMRSHGGANLSGMSLFFGLNALNFAEMDRPFGFLESSQIAEMFFCLGLQCNYSLRYCSQPFMLGLLLSCDWLLNLRTSIWEQKGKEESVRKEVANGFKKDMESLAHIITLLPSASSRLQLYKSYQRSIEGANPLHTQVLLSTTGLPVLRKRGQGKELLTVGDSLALQSPEHAMAKVFAYKHLPPALEVPGSVGGDMLMTHCHKTGQPLVERPTALPSPSALASSSNSASSRSSVSSSSLSISRLPASINSTSATASTFTAAASAKQTSV